MKYLILILLFVGCNTVQPEIHELTQNQVLVDIFVANGDYKQPNAPALIIVNDVIKGEYNDKERIFIYNSQQLNSGSYHRIYMSYEPNFRSNLGEYAWRLDYIVTL